MKFINMCFYILLYIINNDFINLIDRNLFFVYMLVLSIVWMYKIVYILNICMKNVIEYGGGDEIVLINYVYKFIMNVVFEYSI